MSRWTSNPFHDRAGLTETLSAAQDALRAEHGPGVWTRDTIALEVYIADQMHTWHPITTDQNKMPGILKVNEAAEHTASYRLRRLK